MVAPRCRSRSYGRQPLDFSVATLNTDDLNLSTSTFDFNASVTTFATNVNEGHSPAQFTPAGEMAEAANVMDEIPALPMGGRLSTHIENDHDDRDVSTHDDDDVLEATGQPSIGTHSGGTSDETPSIKNNNRNRNNKLDFLRAPSTSTLASFDFNASVTTFQGDKPAFLNLRVTPSGELVFEEKIASTMKKNLPIVESDNEKEEDHGPALHKIPSTPKQEKSDDEAEPANLTPSVAGHPTDDDAFAFTSPTDVVPVVTLSEASSDVTPTAAANKGSTEASTVVIPSTSCRSRAERRAERHKWAKLGKVHRKKKKKVVQFPLCIVTEYLSPPDETKQRDMELTWYTPADLKQIEASILEDIRMAQSGVPEKEPYCYRGIDVTAHQRERREQAIKRSIQATLIEQEHPKRSAKSIAKVYAALSEPCQTYANTVGKLDEKATLDVDAMLPPVNPKDGLSHSDHGRKPPRSSRRRSSRSKDIAIPLTVNLKDGLSNSDHGHKPPRSSGRRSSMSKDILCQSDHGSTTSSRRRRSTSRRRSRSSDNGESLLDKDTVSSDNCSFSSDCDHDSSFGEDLGDASSTKRVSHRKRSFLLPGRRGKNYSAFSADDEGEAGDCN